MSRKQAILIQNGDEEPKILVELEIPEKTGQQVYITSSYLNITDEQTKMALKLMSDYNYENDKWQLRNVPINWPK